MRKDVYQKITGQIVAELEKGAHEVLASLRRSH
jgi:antirestriction protein ArdC